MSKPLHSGPQWTAQACGFTCQHDELKKRITELELLVWSMYDYFGDCRGVWPSSQMLVRMEKALRLPPDTLTPS
jgi:hypothetical protein